MDGLQNMVTLDDFAAAKLASLEEESLRRCLTATHRGLHAGAARGQQHLISFCCNDYLGLSQHPLVKQAATAALEQFGAGAGASRLVTGNHPLYAALEDKLAQIKGAEAACVFGSGFMVNLGVPPALVSEPDLVIADELIHASLHAGLRMSRAQVRFFAHNDVEQCRSLLLKLRKTCRHCLILTEGVFSMDGDRAPLRALCDLAEKYDSWLMVDDAHGLGVLGNGRGSAEEAGIRGRIPLNMGTLSKAVGSHGGFLCSSKLVIDMIVNRARSLIYATGLPPATVAAATKALELIELDRELVASPLRMARRFTTTLNLPHAESAIVPIIVGDPTRALAASQALEARGFLVTAIRPPTVPQGTSRLRFTFSAMHSANDVDRLIAAVRDVLVV